MALPESPDVDLSEIDFTQINKPTYSNTYDKGGNKNDKSKHKNYQLFQFDPNEIDESEWEKLGFSEKQAAAIVKYRTNYGPFKSVKDISKVYVIDDKKFKEIEPYILLEEIHFEKKFIDINSATEEELESISGIGPTFSNRTVKYRELLGGYSSADQFAGIYGITEEAKLALEENVLIDPVQIKKIAINSAAKDEIRKHPYLKDWMVVTEILTQRDRSTLQNLDFLLEKSLITKNDLDNLLPYISFE